MNNLDAFQEALAEAHEKNRIYRNEVDRLRLELDQLHVQLASCLMAAEGHIYDSGNVATPGMYGWSVAYEKIKELRQKYDNRLPYVLTIGKKK